MCGTLETLFERSTDVRTGLDYEVHVSLVLVAGDRGVRPHSQTAVDFGGEVHMLTWGSEEVRGKRPPSPPCISMWYKYGLVGTIEKSHNSVL